MHQPSFIVKSVISAEAGETPGEQVRAGIVWGGQDDGLALPPPQLVRPRRATMPPHREKTTGILAITLNMASRSFRQSVGEP